MHSDPPPAPILPEDAPVSSQEPLPTTLSGGQKAVVGILAGCGGLLVLCCGGSGAVLVAQTREIAVRKAAETRAADEHRGRAEETRVMLEQIADRLRAMPELPAELPESPPEDAWGTPVRYRRSTERRAVLTSAGPDGNFAGGTDNVIVEVLID